MPLAYSEFHSWLTICLLWAIAIVYESCVFVEMVLGTCVQLSWLAPWALFLGICCWDTVIYTQFFKTLPSHFPGWLPHCTAPPAAYKDHGFSKSLPILATLFDDSYPSKCEDLSWWDFFLNIFLFLASLFNVLFVFSTTLSYLPDTFKAQEVADKLHLAGGGGLPYSLAYFMVKTE